MPDPEYPGVYVDEVPTGSKPIEGVDTTTAAFVGPTCRGPVGGEPLLVTGLADFERVFGDGGNLTFTDAAPVPNFIWHATRAFFAEGGKRLRIARIQGPRRRGAQGDESRPGVKEYLGQGGTQKGGLAALELVGDVAVVAAPGSSFGYESGGADTADAIEVSLTRHAEKMRDRFALLDCGDGQSVARVRAMRARLDSSWAGFFYPWLRIKDPLSGGVMALPPSGFVAGIYARNDLQHGVHKAPANEAVKLALALEQPVDTAAQNVLNAEGINCFRVFPGRGIRLWGARTASSDPAWKYVNVRRLFIYLEQSIQQGTQWVVFEPNGEPLWVEVRRAIDNFLADVWKRGALAGARQEDAFFVRCDRTTMTQDDLDNGRLICLVGVAPIKPAEFVIFRVAQKTADG